MNKIYVIAGTAREATDWIKSNLQKRILNNETAIIGISEYAYVTGVDTLRGIRDPHGVFVGNWMGRPDIYEIVQTLIWSSIHVNKQLHDIHNSLKMKVRPTPKIQGYTYSSVIVDEAANLLAKEIDKEVLKSLMKTNGTIA